MQDPQGAVFYIMEPSSSEQRPETEPEIGQASWHELMTTDWRAAMKFYEAVFHWQPTEQMDMGEMGAYTMFVNNGMPVGGIMPTVGEHADVPPHWSTYIAVADVDAAAGRVTSLGGTVMVPAFDVPTIGRMSLCQDPQGAVFWLFKSEY